MFATGKTISEAVCVILSDNLKKTIGSPLKFSIFCPFLKVIRVLFCLHEEAFPSKLLCYLNLCACVIANSTAVCLGDLSRESTSGYRSLYLSELNMNVTIISSMFSLVFTIHFVSCKVILYFVQVFNNLILCNAKFSGTKDMNIQRYTFSSCFACS